MVGHLRLCLAILFIIPTLIKAFVLSPLGRGVGVAGVQAEFSTHYHAQTCICMGCRNNLKKEKRIRNRVNAFRFKKGTPNRFQNNFADRSKAKAAEGEDATWNEMIFTYSAAAAAEATEAPVAAEAA